MRLTLIANALLSHCCSKWIFNANSYKSNVATRVYDDITSTRTINDYCEDTFRDFCVMPFAVDSGLEA